MFTFPADMTVSQKQAFEKRYRQAAASYFPMRAVMPDYNDHKKWLKEHGSELFILDT